MLQIFIQNRLKVRGGKALRAGFPLLFLLVNVLPLTVYAKTPAQYREEVKEARILIESLIYGDVEDASPAERRNFERQALAQIRSGAARQERIDWQAATVETNNRWLIEKLDEFEKQPEKSPNRAEILTEISERLASIEGKLNELETASEQRAKDEDKKKLSEILRREEYAKPDEAEESFFARTWRRFKEWLNRSLPQPDIKPTETTTGFESLSVVLQIMFYAIIAGIAGFLIYRFAPFFARKFKNRERREKRERVILGERLAADATAQNLFAEAEQLAQSGNLRGAIRKGYVAVLCELNDRKIIGLARHKTNRDYLRDVRTRGELFENMNGLTTNFERHWYGLDAVDEKDWNEFKDGYKKVVSL